MATEICIPNPEYLIKSIAEQGYTLETSIADLIDNSISAGAKRIEVLVNTQKTPFSLFISDDGCGMSKEELKKNMNFPSGSMEEIRTPEDLGRFGLGLKTASFAQTRRVTVISKKSDDKKYNGRTWDVNHLRECGNWEVIINSDEEINKSLIAYRELSHGFLNQYSNFNPNTIIIWHGLYKFETGIPLNDKYANLQKELTETTKEYLQLIFHRFMEKENPLRIRLNNEQLKPFDPFPKNARNISIQQKLLVGNKLRLEGFVLPNRSISESKESSEWTISHKSLMDMEGLYVYRADRIIVFGGWNGLIKKSSRLQLARLKVEIGNGIDNLFHLNVAKSSITIPFGERIAFVRYVSELKTEAEKEFFNYETRGNAIKNSLKSLFKKIPTTNGMILRIDEEFPLVKEFTHSLNEEQRQQLRIIFRIITTTIDRIKKVYVEDNYSALVENGGIQEGEINKALKILLEQGISKENILNEIIPSLGINSQSLPASILSLIK